MGFDVYGIKPQINEGTSEPKIPNGHDNLWHESITDEERSVYFEETQVYEAANPGVYFRNNVWHWRPLWGFICHEIAPNILTETDKNSGEYNDDYVINAIKAIYIADRIDALDKEGILDEYEKDYTETISELPDEICQICQGPGFKVIENEKKECHNCNGKGQKPNFAKHYPFNADNIRNFAKFARESGGFRIT
tara:strand:+ start:733 stop:1314 length:582 start_codon:yes stop_codon:yes gene_type:complete